MNNTPQILRARLQRRPVLVAPGVIDPLTAVLAVNAGFEALYLTGAGIAYSRLGMADVGLTTMTEVTEVVARIADKVDVPLIVDGDTGFGNAITVQRTIRFFERAGAAAIQIEDQTFPKRCGHLRGKDVVPTEEMVGKIKAAVDARINDIVVIGRTDAGAVEGFERAFERAERYIEAGADVIFVEAPRTNAELAAVPTALGGKRPLMANMVEGGRTPMTPVAELEAMGYDLVVFSAGVVRAMAKTARSFYDTLMADGTSDAIRDQMYSFDELADIVGTSELLEQGRKYDSDGGGA
ncbi:isocitrate lyase/PEP mutase family protein [Phreatobacter sp. AB_2022a]|uniref:isocitrate lyase/PEP mutase family protein n=1 Tax=Phreatobacter sp. AB_2022a TaxID=3003134 RepID=UPI0022874D46|nr:isocitrate lyase/phosphoenolpyruvate mutase family protein [Phreatobacter sp. AB_2022a]MCZ0733904.1 isocitrate lyase/phosphoenolpyruvate mutase family protein [Phreatobacter sp. AB_2022a]